ncbi:MAG: class I SAM-dependent methyltransferase [Pleurocapsa sp.]
MAILENPILLPFLRLMFRSLIGKDNLKLYDTFDWQQTNSSFGDTDNNYPQYYSSKDFHGIKGGYLNAIAPVTYDAVTKFAAPPNENKLRQQAIALVEHQPKNILDLGCGTGSSTIMLKKAFAKARVTGLDISPYMLVMAEHKANKANLEIDWQQGLAEASNVADESFDLISIAFWFHETPVGISQVILHECRRILQPGGQIVILDGNQQRLRHTPWLIRLFREPYSQVYAGGNVDNWLKCADFVQVKTQSVGWISQLTTCFKPAQSSVN